MNKPILYILCGVPGAGKTSWANSFRQNINTCYVSRDDIRMSLLKEGEDYFSHEKEVFFTFVKTIATNLDEGYHVIADATHINAKSRAKLIHAVDMYVTNYEIIFIYFNIDVELCLTRNAMRKGRACVPEDTLRAMYDNFTVPSSAEDRRCIGVWEVK